MKREEFYRIKYRSESDFWNAADLYIVFYNTKISVVRHKDSSEKTLTTLSRPIAPTTYQYSNNTFSRTRFASEIGESVAR